MSIKSTQSLPIVLSAVVALGLSGCAEKRTCHVPKVKKAQKVEVPMLKPQDAKDKQIEALEVAILEARANAGKTVTKVVEVAGENSIYPPNAEPGKCYKKVVIPAKYETQTEKVLAKEASENITIIPAKYRTVTKKVLVKEASQKLIAVPATYKTVTEKVLVKEASERLVKVPATYGTTTEKILVREATTAWKKGCSSSGECGVMCYVNIPAQYTTVTKRFLKTPATTKVVPIPAQYKTVTRKVLDRPATTKVVPIPAVYKTIQIRELVEPATVKRTPVPERYQTVTKKVKVSESALKWVETSCHPSVRVQSTNNTKRVDIKSLQRTLKEAGFNPGPIDGIYGPRTRAAVKKFEEANSLAISTL